jgi:hypothetical protein
MFWDIADSNRAPEDAELADVIDKMGNPDAMTLSQIKVAAISNSDFYQWISERENRRAIPHRLEKCGYVTVRNDGDKSDGQWKIGGSRVTVYARKALSLKERLGAAAALAGGLRPIYSGLGESSPSTDRLTVWSLTSTSTPGRSLAKKRLKSEIIASRQLRFTSLDTQSDLLTNRTALTSLENVESPRKVRAWVLSC